MKINAKDVASGALLILIAATGLWLNQDHNLGSARRMGPGYMPMLVFYVQLALGMIVLAMAFFNGPDPLEKWTKADATMLPVSIIAGTLAWYFAPVFGSFFENTYNALGLGMLVGFLVVCYSMGWRLLGFICAAMCIFSLLLEKGGLMLALAATIGISALAEPEHRARPLGVLGLTIFLLAMCWWIFIKQLDIRVAVWPLQY
ncbi:tripartite tricarboxylate transporter TctB family protein [Paeniroseomonas aquatica]|uniref:Tripartite tricarboxylate transporter TctB family protein n=1 Tax=Paeniroseomonas aquatica TaxID=373043 RepID=A0ABT8A281_9PROT|nr:tripartite tricarboxylate transporter TctB family protein [Paeniroseomonas aquatica]MDN3563844.1 tripartite tricarboxylate transporter TctB family protein [Paeniroseomonas aquatica]